MATRTGKAEAKRQGSRGNFLIKAKHGKDKTITMTRDGSLTARNPGSSSGLPRSTRTSGVMIFGSTLVLSIKQNEKKILIGRHGTGPRNGPNYCCMSSTSQKQVLSEMTETVTRNWMLSLLAELGLRNGSISRTSYGKTSGFMGTRSQVTLPTSFSINQYFPLY